MTDTVMIVHHLVFFGPVELKSVNFLNFKLFKHNNNIQIFQVHFVLHYNKEKMGHGDQSVSSIDQYAHV
jgi:hypothetical protein